MSEVRFPVMITRPQDQGSTTITVHNLQELQKALSNEIKVSYGYASMCEASEIVVTFKRRGYWVKNVRFTNFDGDDN